MDRRRFLATSVAFATVSIAGCTGGNGNNEGTEPGDGGQNENGGSEADATVTAVDVTFDPIRLEVEPGTTVEWVNEDDFAHDVTSEQFHDAAADWDVAKDLPAGATVSNTFDSEGIYEYYCTIHGQSNQCGVVLVGDVSLDASLPCE
ncbi:cupredoxin domain-containing protein [Halomicroarcula sp. F13]|uniref:Cupredoxin domain-containing protein n=1 Tax=Haloarcula rubra TaxID=2487747 RepID=A0AAW4PU73_9EURY|nr:plastocyanin/azurin family copper-binding protein [Halomicroarcula rubra]MBX0324851.1 cupredoxin domain-containing protein [Halomicroarcula rubra]